MKKLQAGNSEQGADHNAVSVRSSIAPRNPCPYAPDCRTHWIVDAAAETADCAHCYQTHSRADLARMLAGRA